MIRRIDLLPDRYRARKRERKVIALMVLGGLVCGSALGAWWYFLEDDVTSSQAELAAIQTQNAQLQSQINELSRFVQLEIEVQSKRTALQTVMTGDIAWPSVLTEIAMVIPGEVWLETITASAGQTEGAAPVGTETAAVRISDAAPTGRIQFAGKATSMTGVSRWLLRLGTVNAFSAIWLNSATGPAPGTTVQEVFAFDSTLELGVDAFSQRYLGDLP